MFEDLLPGGGPSKKELEAAEKSEKRQLSQNKELSNQDLAMRDNTLLPEIESKSDLIKWQQELDDELQNLVFTVLGFTIEDKILVKTDNSLCNKLFVQQVIIPQCRPYMSRNLINSNFTEERILLDLKCTCNDISDAMVDGFDKYCIKFTDYDLIMRMIKNTIKAGAFRALNGWTKRTDSTVIRRLESQTESVGGDQNKKILGLFGGTN